MNKPLIIIGAGDHAKVLLDILLEQGEKVIGLTDKTVSKGSLIYDVPVIGSDEAILQYSTEEIELVNGIGSVKDMSLRKKIFCNFKNKGYSFKTVVHSSAVISKRAVVKEGSQILAGAVINTEADIGENTIINTKASIDHGCKIEKHCHIAPGCVLCGCVNVGQETHIGTGTSIIQGINIGKNVLIGAGSLVLRDVCDNEKVFGLPAEVRK